MTVICPRFFSNLRSITLLLKREIYLLLLHVRTEAGLPSNSNSNIFRLDLLWYQLIVSGQQSGSVHSTTTTTMISMSELKVGAMLPSKDALTTAWMGHNQRAQMNISLMDNQESILSSAKLAATSATRNGLAGLQIPKFDFKITARRRWTRVRLLLTSVKTNF